MATSVQHANHSIDHDEKRPKSGEDKPKKVDCVAIVGRIAAVLSVIMYVSYVAQIANNLAGHPGTPWQPLAAFFNCSFWTAYGFMKPKKDIPIIVANVPGIVLALITVITTFIH